MTTVNPFQGNDDELNTGIGEIGEIRVEGSTLGVSTKNPSEEKLNAPPLSYFLRYMEVNLAVHSKTSLNI